MLNKCMDKMFAMRLKAFQTSARTYFYQKEDAVSLVEKYPALKKYVQIKKDGRMILCLPKNRNEYTVPYTVIILYKLMLEDLFFVEMILERVNHEFGNEALELVTLVFLKNQSQEESGKTFHMTRRQVQTRLQKIMMKVLGENNG